MGILIEKEGPADKNFPARVWVENGRTITEDVKLATAAPLPGAEAENKSITDDGYLWMVDRAEKRRSRK